MMKQKIESKIGKEPNVKLSKGGLRDIEFIVQALQLLKSGIDENLREKNTLQAIAKLQYAGLLKVNESRTLRRCYVHFREIEHRLQLLHGAQTHSLPENKNELRFLSKRLGFQSIDDFGKSLRRAQREVRSVFDSILKAKTVGVPRAADGFEISLNELSRMSARGGFHDLHGAVESLRKLIEENAMFRNERLLAKILKTLKNTGAADWGIANLRILCSSPTARSIVVHAIGNENTRNLLVTICARSKRLTERFATEPLLFESMLGQADRFFDEGLDWNYFLKSDPLRFRMFNESKAVIRFLLGYSTLEKLSLELTGIADALVRSIAEDSFAKRSSGLKPFQVVAMGKYGGGELIVGSDLDMMILYEHANEFDPSYQTFAQDFARGFVLTGERVYDVDMRLRPEGKNAPLATEFLYYENYLQRRAQVWEVQALLKARSVFGEEGVKEKFRNLRTSTVRKIAEDKDWLKKIAEMRKRMEIERTKVSTARVNLKVGAGGLVDLEFVTQAIQLKDFSRNPSLDTANTFLVIRAATKARKISLGSSRILETNYRFLRKLELAIRLNSESREFVLPKVKEELHCIAAFMDERSIQNLKSKIDKIRRQNRSLMKTEFSKLGAR